MVIAFFSVFLSIKVYGECYSAIYLLRNELGKIDYIRDGINLTFNDVTNVDYLNNLVRDNLLSTNKWNLKDEDKVLISKMLVDFGENILVFLNASRNDPESNLNKLNQSVLTTDTLGAPTTNAGTFTLIRSLFSHLSLTDLKFNFEIVSSIVNSRANSYLPLLKSGISIFYTFIFVILDGGFAVLGFVLNCVSFKFIFSPINLKVLFFSLYSHWLYSTCSQPVVKSTSPLSFWTTLYLPSLPIASRIASVDMSKRWSTASLLLPSKCQPFTAYTPGCCTLSSTFKFAAFHQVSFTFNFCYLLTSFSICPQAIAAILAAVPLLNACWASLPACLYLYYFDQNLPLLKSLAMFIMAILPSFVVDSSIYSDIKRWLLCSYVFTFYQFNLSFQSWPPVPDRPCHHLRSSLLRCGGSALWPTMALLSLHHHSDDL